MTSTAKLRRGTTSSVQIVKDFIDLVGFQDIHVRGGATLSNLTNGRTSAGKGFLQMKLTVPPGQSLGSTITLDVGLIDHFNFTVQHTGMLSSVTFAPNPSTVVAGTPIVINGTGVDFGTANVTTVSHRRDGEHDLDDLHRDGNAERHLVVQQQQWSLRIQYSRDRQ